MSPGFVSYFIDGQYYTNLQRDLGVFFDLRRFLVESQEWLVGKTSQSLELVHSLYYDALPPLENGNREFYQKRLGYFNFLKTIPGVRVREGRVVRNRDSSGNVWYQQKQVDLLLGLDIAEECSKGFLTHLVLVAGDSDFCPAVEFASKRGVQTLLVHGLKGAPNSNYSDQLWTLADQRLEIDLDFASRVKKEDA